MPRRPRLRVAGVPFHVIQRGNNRTACFFRDEDYQRYLNDLRAQARKHGVAIHAYVLMTNHVHLLATPQNPDGVGLLMKFLGQLYVQYVNRSYRRTGSLWEGRFRSCLVDTEGYLLYCHRYIECNPVRAGMAKRPGDYPWSSYRANAEGADDPLLTAHAVVQALGRTPVERQAAYRELFRQDLEPGVVDQIRDTTNGGFALGSDRFRQDIAYTLGRYTERQRRGPKPKAAADPRQDSLRLPRTESGN
jgi:putative transposase